MAISDTGLLVRYYFDEAASGTSPTSVLDRSGSNLPLDTINYGSGNMTYYELSAGKRGLDSSTTSGTQRARRSVHDTSDAIRNGLAGVQKATFEVVVDIQAVLGPGSVTSIGGIRGATDGNNEIFMNCDALTANGMMSYWDDQLSNRWTAPSGRTVIHLVYDTTQAVDADRIIAYHNGVAQSMSVSAAITQNATLALATGLELIFMNRYNGGSYGKSFDGALYYAALYNVAFDTARCAAHSSILVDNDDNANVLFVHNEVTKDISVGYWPLDDASGSPKDASGNQYDLTTTTSTPNYRQLGPFPSSYAMRYPASTGHSRSTQVSTVTNNFTMELWYRPMTVGSNDRSILYNGNDSTNGWGIQIDTNLTFQYLCGGVAWGASSATTLVAGTWYHIVVLRRAGTWEYYVNGSIDTANAGTTAPNTPSGTTYINGYTNHDMLAAHAAIYETALSASRIQTHYLAGTLMPGAVRSPRMLVL